MFRVYAPFRVGVAGFKVEGFSLGGLGVTAQGFGVQGFDGVSAS